MKKKMFFQPAMAGTLAAFLLGSSILPASAEEFIPPEHVTLSAPSLFQDSDGVYYLFGSHTAIASSEDLIHWNTIASDGYNEGAELPVYGSITDTFSKPFAWSGYDDGDCQGSAAILAPDVIWNPLYEWEDGSTGAYMLYCGTPSTWKRSSISFLASRSLDEPFTFGDTILYSGFTMTGDPDGKSERDTKWDNEYLNLREFLEKDLQNKDGDIENLGLKWFQKDGSWNFNYAPSAMDPDLFFSADGTAMFLSYGSRAGGFYLMPLDPATGKALYPGSDYQDEESGNPVDRYFGIHLAGGLHTPGKASSIVYDEESGFYYMYATYGDPQLGEDQNLRMFQSENARGPYLDLVNNSAAGNPAEIIKDSGIKLMGNYAFAGQPAKTAATNCSALINAEGERYLAFYQTFEQTENKRKPEIRIHQQFLNEDLWPTLAVYEYCGDQPSNYEEDEVTGTYEYLNHHVDSSAEIQTPEKLVLEKDGTLSGAETGTWKKTDSGKGYNYLTITTKRGVVYKGFFFRQHKEDDARTEVMTFSAIGSDDTCIWGSMEN